MEFINDCIMKGYGVINIDEHKKPGVSKWSKLSNKELLDSCDITKKGFAMRMGKQDNGDVIINLDFDIMEKNKKTKKYKKNNITSKLLDEWKELNEDDHGLFISSTQNNMGNLINIKDCPELIKLLADIGKARFQNSKDKITLELLCSCLCVLPPTRTVCKVFNKPIQERAFLNDDHPILLLEKDTEMYNFVYNYATEFKNRNFKRVKQRDIRSKVKKEIYNDVKDGKYKSDDLDHVLELLLLLSEERYNYDSWWKVAIALYNSYEKEFAEKVFDEWSKRDTVNYDGDIPFDDWYERREDYDGLNWNMIMRWIEYDSPSKFIPCIQKYRREKSSKEYDDFKNNFESKYHFCKDPQVFFYKSMKGQYIQKTTSQVMELEKHNKEYFAEWMSDENRKIYEMSDSVPMKHLKNPNVFNIFRGYKFWEWEDDWMNEAQLDMDDLKSKTMNWWNKYLYLLCGKNDEMVHFVKMILGNVIYNPTRPSKVFIIFQGIEGTGKSFLINILNAVLGHLNIAESSCAKRELFGPFNEPLLNAQVVCIDESDPKMMDSILSELKSKITNHEYIVNCKNEKNFRRKNTLQWFATTNDPNPPSITTTNRRFIAVKTSSELARMNADTDEHWDFGYDVLLETDKCLQYICADIYHHYDTNNGWKMNFKNARPHTNYMSVIIKNNIPPLFTFLQHICKVPSSEMIEYELTDKTKSFASWYHQQHRGQNFKPLYDAGLKAIGASGTGFWSYMMSDFRKDLNGYIKNTLDKTDQLISDEIYMQLSNFFENDESLFRRIGDEGTNSMYYLLNPLKTIEQLKLYKYYQSDNDDSEKCTSGVKNMFAMDPEDYVPSKEETKPKEQPKEIPKKNIVKMIDERCPMVSEIGKKDDPDDEPNIPMSDDDSDSSTCESCGEEILDSTSVLNDGLCHECARDC